MALGPWSFLLSSHSAAGLVAPSFTENQKPSEENSYGFLASWAPACLHLCPWTLPSPAGSHV